MADCYEKEGKEEENMYGVFFFGLFIIKRGHSLERHNPLAESISVSIVN